MADYTNELWNEQVKMEERMRNDGIQRFQKQEQEARKASRESDTDYGRCLASNGLESLAQAIRDFLDQADSGKSGRRSGAAKILWDLEPEVAALVAIKGVLDNISREQRPLQATAVQLGQRVEDELRYRAFQQQDQKYFDTVNQDLQKRTSNAQWRHRVIVGKMNKRGIEFDPISETDKLKTGIKLAELVQNTLGIVELSHYRDEKGKTHRALVTTPDMLKWIKKREVNRAAMFPQFMPCVIPPRDWSTPFDGGYHTKAARTKQFRLVKPVKALKKSVKDNYLEEIAGIADQMPEVYEAVNAMQRTPWRINRDVLSVFQQLWDDMETTPQAGLPAKVDKDPEMEVPKPADFDTSEESQKWWKKQAMKVHEENQKNHGKIIQVDRVRRIAELYKDYDAIYFPYQLDFRGRVYAVPMFLQPQGSDLARGLLTFGEGKPINDERAAGWLMIHGANTFGNDKVSLEERIAWVEEHHESILACADDPLGNRWWMDADDPWQFLAFCFEYAGLIREGYGFVSHLPVQLDGSCNGLQHFSAMLRDEVGGEATNLTPSERPNDIYQQVADVVTGKLSSIASAGGTKEDSQELAQQWLDLGVTRKTTKRSVMIMPYGGTRMSMRDYVEEHLKDDRPGEYPWEDLGRPTGFLASIIWEAIGEVVIAGREAMDWLQKVAKLLSKEELPVNWQVPTGFVVMQSYPTMKNRRVKTTLGDTLIYLTLQEATDELDKSKQANAISPNFVHSLDAAAMHKYVVKAREYGLNHFSLIHDSYGTHAADTDLSVDCLRAAFVEMYLNHDPLQEFADQVLPLLSDEQRRKVPPMPSKRNLDIERVLESDYFFA